MSTELKPSLQYGRKQVDLYTQIPRPERTAQEMDQAILAMFSAWDSSRKILKGVVIASATPSARLDNYMSEILFLSDLRDQSGRVASNVMAHVTFGTQIPEQNIIRSLQVQHQVRYLWDIIDTLQPVQDKTDEFIRLHQRVGTEFIQQGLPIVERLIEDSRQQRPYYLTGTQLTEAIVDKFTTVIDLQNYLLQYTKDVAIKEMRHSLNHLIWTVALSGISLITAILTMIFARKRIFIPLIRARKILFDLSTGSERKQAPSKLKQTGLLNPYLQQFKNCSIRCKSVKH